MKSKITYSSIPDVVKKVANRTLGVGVLRSLFNHTNSYHLVMKIDNGTFIGFALYHYHQKSFKDGTSHVTGVIDAVCVDVPYRDESFEEFLIFGALRKMSAYGVDRIEMTVKTPISEARDGEPGVPVVSDEDVLLALNFRRVAVLDGKFAKDSTHYDYDCALCGDKPDSCKAILYAIDSLT